MPVPIDFVTGSIGSFLTDPISDPLVRRAAIEVALIGIAAGALGCWLVHYELAYAAESVAHCMLPGLVVAALAGAPLIVGGAAGLALGVAAIGAAARVPGIGRDTAVAIAVTTLFGAGGLLALGAETPPNLQAVLFGDVLAVAEGELAVAGALVLIVVAALALAHPRLLAAGFDPSGARALGVRVGAVEALLLALLAAAVLVAVQGLGNLLAVGALVGPAAVARLIWKRLGPMMAGAAAIAVLSGVAGLYASYHLELAAGASIAGVTVLICLVALATQATVTRPAGRPRGTPTMSGMEAR
jgi:ABC-type Mn2+/Zn2+ transport system permease subunit